MKPQTPRAARKKLLLLEGALYRLEILEAKDALRTGVTHSFIGQRLPGLLSFLFEHKAGALLTSALPWLLGTGRVSRIVRRGALLLSAVVGLLGLPGRRRSSRPTDEPVAQQDPLAAAEPDAGPNSADKKNPGQSRD